MPQCCWQNLNSWITLHWFRSHHQICDDIDLCFVSKGSYTHFSIMHLFPRWFCNCCMKVFFKKSWRHVGFAVKKTIQLFIMQIISWFQAAIIRVCHKEERLTGVILLNLFSKIRNYLTRWMNSNWFFSLIKPKIPQIIFKICKIIKFQSWSELINSSNSFIPVLCGFPSIYCLYAHLPWNGTIISSMTTTW